MIRIISDSSTLYTIEEGKKHDIDIAPLAVTINGKSYLENEEITSDEFITMIKDGNIPVSSQPAVGDVINLYEKYPEDEIINITMADGLSGTYNSACMAKKLCDNGERIEVVNSKTLCLPQRYIVDTAVSLSKNGKTKEEIIKIIQNLIESTKSFLIPKDFEYLVRGGRLSPLAGKIAGVIKLVPVVTLSDDSTSLVKFTTKRTFKKAVEKICDNLLENGFNNAHKIFISHGGDEESAKLVKEIICENINEAEIEIYKLGPAFITQGEPGCIAIQTIKKY